MTQPQLVQALKSLFPSALQGNEGYTVAVDGSGNASILLWNNELGTQPTPAQLATALTALQLQQAQLTQVAVIAAASSTAQTAGFTSSALGSAYTYPSAADDQANLNHVVTASLIAPSGTEFLFWCKSAAGVEGFVSHTADQIKQVGLDAMAAIMTAKQKQWTLTQQIQAATTIAAVNAVVWS